MLETEIYPDFIVVAIEGYREGGSCNKAHEGPYLAEKAGMAAGPIPLRIMTWHVPQKQSELLRQSVVFSAPDYPSVTGLPSSREAFRLGSGVA
jgi:hypothetical protein